MHVHHSTFDVSLIPPSGAERLEALRLAIDASSAARPETVIDQFLDDSRRRSLCTDLLLGVYAGSRLVVAALAVESPGKAALILAAQLDYAPADAMAICLRQLLDLAWGRSNLLLQMLLPTHQSTVFNAVQDAGFRKLTRLVYLHRPANAPVPQQPLGPILEWVGYTPQAHPLFVEAVRQSYAQSMDCPELTRVRTVEDALAGHKSAGEFVPGAWSVALRGGEPVGVMLLSPVLRQPATEIVYMGVAQPSRRQGVAHSLMARAIAAETASRMAPRRSLLLAVDERNLPARRLYDRWGFTSVGTRDVWIATSHQIKGCVNSQR
jgi:ribosomal protein S18 acetylase RimI-like enzyme